MNKSLKILIIILLFANYYAFGQQFTSQQIKEKEASTQNFFGDSGDIDGDVSVIISVHSHTAYVYNRNPAGKWILSKSMRPKEAQYGDRFGQEACAISGKYVIVGDWMNSTHKTGAAYIFELGEGSDWKQVATLVPTNSKEESFGRRVDIYGNIAVVASSNGIYTFNLGADNKWKQIQFIDEKPLKTSLGYKGLALSKDYLIVGAGYIDSSKGTGYDAALVYKRTKSNRWKYLQKIVSPTEQKRSDFASAISISNTIIAIGANSQDYKRLGATGVVFIYELGTKKFELSQEIYPEDFGPSIYNFGVNVAVSENYLAVLRAQEKNYKGSVTFYHKVDGEYERVAKKVSPINSTNNGNDFGRNGLAIDANRVFVGAPGDSYCDTDTTTWARGKCGSAFMFTIKK